MGWFVAARPYLRDRLEDPEDKLSSAWKVAADADGNIDASQVEGVIAQLTVGRGGAAGGGVLLLLETQLSLTKLS